MESQIETFNRSADEKDRVLWRAAKKRAAFKWSLVTYLAVNAFLIVIWYLSSGPGTYFWPVWPLLGWGFGVAMQYFATYHGDKVFTAENEYEKLKKQNQH